ncbi:hypothetical protein R6Z07F_017331 [Ovis aries]|nr:pregnancy-associated glycoprotein 1-like [Ovis aries]
MQIVLEIRLSETGQKQGGLSYRISLLLGLEQESTIPAQQSGLVAALGLLGTRPPQQEMLFDATQVRFRHYKSSASQPTQETFRIAYGSGSMKVFLVYDTIRGLDRWTSTARRHCCCYYPPRIPPLSSLYTCRTKGSVVMFGGVDKSYCQGALNWITLIKVGDWSVHMDCISMKRKVIACSGDCEAFVDTRTSLILGVRRLVNNILDIIDATPWGSEHYVSCFAVNTLSSVILIINGINYPGPAQAYILKDSRGHCYTTFKENTVRTSRETWILDDVFLMLSFSVFGRENDRIGMAQAV